MICVLASSGSSSYKPDVALDWVRSNCPSLMVYEEPNLTQCTCLDSYYYDGTACQSCPDYCEG